MEVHSYPVECIELGNKELVEVLVGCFSPQLAKNFALLFPSVDEMHCSYLMCLVKMCVWERQIIIIVSGELLKNILNYS